jgi:hypothetical protein
MSENDEIKEKILEWFHGHAKSGVKTKFYMKDIVNALPDYNKRAVQKAINDCTVDGTLVYWSTGSSTMFCLKEDFHE